MAAIPTEGRKPVPGRHGANYDVTDHGDVISLPRRARTANQYGEADRAVPAHVMSTRMKDGGLVTQLCLDGVARNFTVAVLVLEAFGCPRPTPGHIVAYADRDPANCSLSNLSWVPRKGDARFRPKTTRKGDRRSVA